MSTVDESLGISPEQRRVFDAVAEFEDACSEMVMAKTGYSVNRDTFAQMVWSSALSCFGSSWVTSLERDFMVGAACGVYDALQAHQSREWHTIQHEDHIKDGTPNDNNCDICGEIFERNERDEAREDLHFKDQTT